MVNDALFIAERNLRRLPRSPEMLLGYTIQPAMFVLLFVYVFGGAISTPGYDYVDFLIPGIVVQSLAFGGMITGIGLADDLSKGLIDRFRSLPIARSAVLAGRTLSDTVTNAFQLAVLVGVGVICGFSFGEGFLLAMAGVGLALLVGLAVAWITALIGLMVPSVEAVQQFGFTAIFPLTFISSAFVPAESMPAVLEAFANNNPFTHWTDALRHLWLGAPAGDSVWLSLVWVVAIIAIFSTLAVRRYRVVASR